MSRSATLLMTGLLLAAGVLLIPLQAQEREALADFHLRTARLYENLEEWPVAEKHYLEAGKCGSAPLQNQALEGIARVRQKRRAESEKRDGWQLLEDWNRRLGQILSLVGLVLPTVIGILLIVVWLLSVRRNARTIQLIPLKSNEKQHTERLSFWFSNVHSKLWEQHRTPGNAALNVDLPLLHLPGLTQDLPQVGQLEAGGIKIPIADMLQVWNRPRVRISGGWLVDQGKVFARIERRRRLSYSTARQIHRDIPIRAGFHQNDQLELFVYDVYIEAVRTYVS